MLNWLAFPMAAILGFLAGLGVGGGSLLMLWLTLAVGMEYNDARVINLLFFLPCAAVSTFFHKGQGRVDLRKIFPAILAGCVAAAIFSVVGKYIDTKLLKKCFGGILLFTGLRELFYKKK
jgi:uncharacterized membrane protein YfcA